MLARPVDPLTIHEGVVRCHGYRARIVRVSVVVMVVVSHIVMEVVDERVVHIYVAPIPHPAVIPRMERLAPAQREPGMESNT